MRALLQRVHKAAVMIDGKPFSEIGKGLLVYLGIHHADQETDSVWMIKKLLQARVFEDDGGRMSQPVTAISGDLLIVSQVTLYSGLAKGNRPDLGLNMKPREARVFFDRFIDQLKSETSLTVRTGQFAAHMEIDSTNNGPVTLMLDTGR